MDTTNSTQNNASESIQNDVLDSALKEAFERQNLLLERQTPMTMIESKNGNEIIVKFQPEYELNRKYINEEFD